MGQFVNSNMVVNCTDLSAAHDTIGGEEKHTYKNRKTVFGPHHIHGGGQFKGKKTYIKNCKTVFCHVFTLVRFIWPGSQVKASG